MNILTVVYRLLDCKEASAEGFGLDFRERENIRGKCKLRRGEVCLRQVALMERSLERRSCRPSSSIAIDVQNSNYSPPKEVGLSARFTTADDS
jgi:hypothetical protein